MARVLVTTLHRVAEGSQAHGYLIEVDWERKIVTSKFPAPPLWNQFGGRARGGRRGLRGITRYKGLIWVASCDALFGFTPDLQLERLISHPYMSHVHEIEAVEEGIWVTSTNGNGVFLINERQEVLKEAWLEGAPTQDMRVHMEKHYDRFHVNTVSFLGDDVLAYSATTGKVYKMWPGPVGEVAQLEKRCHNVQSSKFGWIRNISGESIFKVGEHVIRTPIRGEKGEFTSPGWLRGLAWLSEDRILIGSSPAMLLEVDLNKREIVAEMPIEEDSAWTTHGIYVDQEKCAERGVTQETPRGTKESKESERARGALGGLFRKLTG